MSGCGSLPNLVGRNPLHLERSIGRVSILRCQFSHMLSTDEYLVYAKTFKVYEYFI